MKKTNLILIFLIFLTANCQTNSPVNENNKKEFKSGQKDFTEIITGHEKSSGMFTIYKGKDTLYFEIHSATYGQQYGFNCALVKNISDMYQRNSSIGSAVIEFQKRGDRVSCVKKNVTFTADQNSDVWHAVKDSFPDSIITQKAVESVNPANNAEIVNFKDMFIQSFDLFDMGANGFSLDKESSAIDWIQNNPDNIAIQMTYHFKKTNTNANVWWWDWYPRPAPDNNNIQVILQYNLYKLPEIGSFRPRPSDSRIGLFEHIVKDYTAIENRESAFRHMAIRFRVEKTDPSQKISKAKKPITFWIEKGVPKHARSFIKDATLWWNTAFEKVGIKDAIEVLEQPDSATWNGSDIRYNVIHWNFSDDLNFSGTAGPNVIDPRTGEVLQTHVWLNAEFFSYAALRYLTYIGWAAPPLTKHQQIRKNFCNRLQSFSSQLAFARLVLKNRGIIMDGNNEEKRFLEQTFKELVVHEVGHAIGFGHNFKASLLSKSSDALIKGIPSSKPFSGSVMDYNPIYIPPKDSTSWNYVLTRLGPYDELAVEYLYNPLDNSTPYEELQALNKIAEKAETEPGLIYDDGMLLDIDPYSSMDDIGNDPLAFAESRLQMIGEILPNLHNLVLKNDKDYHQLRCAMDACVFSIMADYIFICSSYIGGQHISRHYAGKNKQDPIKPVNFERQRNALEILFKYILSGDYYVFPAELRNKLSKTFLYDWNLAPSQMSNVYSIEQRLGWITTYTMNMLLDINRLDRIQDNENRTSDDKILSLPAYFRLLTDYIWSSLEKDSPVAFKDSGKPLGFNRRLLQNIYVDRLESLLLGQSGVSHDIKSLARSELNELKMRVEESIGNFPRLDPYTKAHLHNLFDKIDKILEAQKQEPAK
ncbi:MAG: zinc-dependent metalloprotease [Planctomycetes bacterium]|nr:zinc-dependent metalloprotease [Planctomycetota bacterium]